jgi:hypothetical protein
MMNDEGRLTEFKKEEEDLRRMRSLMLRGRENRHRRRRRSAQNIRLRFSKTVK